jgi:hypothetical protein
VDIYRTYGFVALFKDYKSVCSIDIHIIYKKNYFTMNTDDKTTRTEPRRSKRLCKTSATSDTATVAPVRLNLQVSTAVSSTSTPSIATNTSTTINETTKEEKEKRNLILMPLVSCLMSQKTSSKTKRLPRNAYTQIVGKYKVHYPWMTTDMLKQRVKRASSKLAKAPISPHTNPTPQNPTNANSNKAKANPTKGGRPKGSTIAAKAFMQSCINEAKSEIVDL